MDRSLLEKKPLAELKAIASTLQLTGYQRLRKADLVTLIMETGAAATSAADEAGDGPAAAQPAEEPADVDGASEQRPADDSAARVRARRRPTRGAAPTGDREPRGQDREPRDEPREGATEQGASSAGRDEPQLERDQPREPRATRAEPGTSPAERDDTDEARGRRDRRRKERPGQEPQHEEAEVREGVLDLLPEGYGFLRTTSYLAGPKDVYVSQSFVRRFGLRRGDRLGGPIRRNKNSDKFPALARVTTVEGREVDQHRDLPRDRPDFAELTATYPVERLTLETGADTPLALGLIELVAPLGKGARGLLLAPPRTGKTTLLKQLAAAVHATAPDAELLLVLVDERPEEVTDLARSTQAEIVASTLERSAEDHVQLAELAVERAKRLVEDGRDVVVLLDSLTRLARAANLAVTSVGRALAPGFDAAALQVPKRLLGAARRCEEGGSLTIVATALAETGSAIDQAILEELEGTGTQQVRLDAALARQGRFPAVDVVGSSTRREDLLRDLDDVARAAVLRREVEQAGTLVGVPALVERLAAAGDAASLLAQVTLDDAG